MNGGTENLMLELLRQMRGDITSLRNETRDGLARVEIRLGLVEQGLAGLLSVSASDRDEIRAHRAAAGVDRVTRVRRIGRAEPLFGVPPYDGRPDRATRRPQEGGGEECGPGPGLRRHPVDALIDLVRQARHSPLRQFLQIALDLDHEVAHHPPGPRVHQTDL